MEKEGKDIREISEEKEIKELQQEIKIKPKKDLEKRNDLGIRIFNIVFWVLIFALFAVWVTDFTIVKLEKDPIFCISKKTHDYDNGEVKECIGLGYKVYQYDLTDKTAVEFSPFYSKINIE